MTIEEQLAELVSTQDGVAKIREATQFLGGSVRIGRDGERINWSDIVLAILVQNGELQDEVAELENEIALLEDHDTPREWPLIDP
jgi:hypothetical protein